jgi:FlgD Ig-like domain
VLHSVRLPRTARVALVVSLLVFAPAAQAVRIVNYNLNNYPASTSAIRNPYYQTVLGPLAADVVVVQEMQSQSGVDIFRDQVLNVVEPGQWASAPFINGNDTDNALFYKPSKVQLLGSWAFYPNPATNLRLVSVYRLKPVGYTSSAAEFRIYSCHLKASSGSSNATARYNEAIGIRDSMNAVAPGTHSILLGDFNIYTSNEAAFGKFLESQVDNDGRLYDPLNAVGTWNNAAFAAIHTQCPCLNNCPPGFGFAGGGLDDRFDMFLPTYNLNDGNGLELLLSTYKPVGNDGLHYNKDLNVAPVIPEGQTYADALVDASDHLPVRVDLQVPAQITVASALDFGSVIVGAAASQSLTVTNAASPPADDLDYSFSADPGFSAPGGTFSLAAGGSAPHTISMSTVSAAVHAGQLDIASDDPDHPSKLVSLSGTVLDHAAGSLDSLALTFASVLDFGDHETGSFTDETVRVHDFGYDTLQARLSVDTGAITGPAAARFTIVGGFNSALVAGISEPYTLHFDDAGAAADSTYDATLTFTTSDEPLPGATTLWPLSVTLRARVTLATDVASALPVTDRLHAPYPNPVGRDGATIRFDLAHDANVRLEVFDVAGHRVSSIVTGGLAAGVHRAHWAGLDAQGRGLPAGVYFVRLHLPGRDPQTVRVTRLR